MSSLEALTGRNHLSHSSLSTWLECGEKFWLERVVKVPQSKAWYRIGGSAFHTATEWLDRGESQSFSEAWQAAWDKQVAEELDGYTGEVRAGGRASKQWPDKENADWWQANGYEMLFQYVGWRNRVFSAGWRWYELPNGDPAVEVPVEMELGGVQVKGFIDRIMVNDDGELIVVDLKTGSHTPASSIQLGIYAAGVERHFGVRPILGSYYMARKAELTQPVSLLHYTPELLGSWFGKAKQGIEEEIFVPHPTSLCSSCSVRIHCSAFGGSVDKDTFKV